MEPPFRQPPRAPAGQEPDVVRFGRRVVLRFLAHGMTVYAGALAYRGLLALVPLALIVLALVGLLGIEGSFPRLTAALLRLRGAAGPGGAAAIPLEGLLSAGAVVGIWSIATGARLLMRALDAAHAVEKSRPTVARFAFSLVFLPALAVVTVAAMVLLLATTRIIRWAGGWIGVGPVLDFLGSWLRLPAALGLLALAVGAVFRWGPGVRPPGRAVAAGAALTVVLWAVVSAGFGLAVSTVLDYGSTYGGLGAAVALLVYLNLLALVLLLGAEVSAEIAGRPGGAPGGGTTLAGAGRDPSR
jgi:membrane protein